MGKPNRPEKVRLEKDEIKNITELLLNEIKREDLTIGERNMAIHNLIAFGLNTIPWNNKKEFNDGMDK